MGRALVFVAWALLLLAAGCSSTSSNQVVPQGDAGACTPGDQKQCPCVGGTIGVQACASDGKSWGACNCGTGGTGGFGGSGGSGATGGGGGSTGGSGATGGSAGVAGTGGSAGSTTAGNLGRSCGSDADCGGDGLTCLLPTSGAAGGLCTKACTTDSECGGGVCIDLLPNTSTKYCLEKCSFGPTTSTVLDPNKCHGRSDMACVSTPGGDVCRPLCNSDADCSPLYCDPGTGLCTQAPPTGDPIGAPCDAAGMDNCKGLCLALSTQASATCSALCTTGVTPSCGTSTGATSRAYCDTTGANGVGDISYCIPVCDCTAQCAYNGVVIGKCIELDTDAQQAAGGRGICVPVDVTGTEITFCQ